MFRLPAIVTALALCMGLAACGGGGGSAGGEAGGGTGRQVPVADGGEDWFADARPDEYGRVEGEISRSDVPRPRDGLWEIITEGDEIERQRIEYCQRGEALDIVPEGPCPNVVVRREDDGFRVDWRCVEADGRSAMRTHWTGDFRTAYHARVETRTRPDSGAERRTRMSLDAKYLGDCRS